jgi:hypothetical protein
LLPATVKHQRSGFTKEIKRRRRFSQRPCRRVQLLPARLTCPGTNGEAILGYSKDGAAFDHGTNNDADHGLGGQGSGLPVRTGKERGIGRSVLKFGRFEKLKDEFGVRPATRVAP